MWHFISEPDHYRDFMDGITRWDVEGRKRTGLGARYAMRMRIGSTEIGGLIELVEFDEPFEIAWTGVTGIDQRGRWRLHERGGDETDVTLRIGYHTEGGLLGTFAEWFAVPIVRSHLRRSLQELKRQLEQPSPSVVCRESSGTQP